MKIVCFSINRSYIQVHMAQVPNWWRDRRKLPATSESCDPAPRHRPYTNRPQRIQIDSLKKKSVREKRVRDDKDVVLNMLFAAFEKHQYYKLNDLQKITKQPIVYLKEILKETCDYNFKNPHKNMWELKPEYRYYKQEQPAETKEDKNSSDSD